MGHWIVVNDQAVNLDHFVMIDIQKHPDGSGGLLLMCELPSTIDLDVELDGVSKPADTRAVAITGRLAQAVLNAISSMPEEEVT